ncbi:MAG: hypothetical protein M3Y69_04900, partial [Verrucomicrobiota bacterium]|nr:hypothetical protein [Verrucomicrobiota bacterium]
MRLSLIWIRSPTPLHRHLPDRFAGDSWGFTRTSCEIRGRDYEHIATDDRLWSVRLGIKLPLEAESFDRLTALRTKLFVVRPFIHDR